MTVLLELKNVVKKFGGITALSDISFQVNQGDIFGIIGPNGAGKTTIFNMITGVYPVTSGDVLFNGKSIEGKKTFEIIDGGIARTFQNIRLFGELSVLENVKIAFTLHSTYTFPEAILRLGRYGREEQIIDDRARELLAAFKLDGLAEEQAKNLPYGQQRRLEIARALAPRPKLLLLDEPAAGMNPQETKELTEMIRWIRDTYRLSILLIEHDMALVMHICERIYVLDYGKILAEGTPDEIKNNPAVIKAYLGTEG